MPKIIKLPVYGVPLFLVDLIKPRCVIVNVGLGDEIFLLTEQYVLLSKRLAGLFKRSWWS